MMMKNRIYIANLLSGNKYAESLRIMLEDLQGLMPETIHSVEIIENISSISGASSEEGYRNVVFCLSYDFENSDDDNEVPASTFICFGVDGNSNATCAAALDLIEGNPFSGVFQYNSCKSLCTNAIYHLAALEVIKRSEVIFILSYLYFNGYTTKPATETEVNNAIALAELTYSCFGEDKMFKEFLLSEKGAKGINVCNDVLNSMLRKAKDLRNKRLNKASINEIRRKVSDMLDRTINMANKISSEDEAKTVHKRFNEILAFVDSFECPNEWLYRIYEQYIFFLESRNMIDEAYIHLSYLIDLAESLPDIEDKKRYICYYIGYWLNLHIVNEEIAHQMAERYLGFAEKHPEENWSYLLVIYHNFAFNEMQNGNNHKAFEYGQKVWEIIQKHPPLTREDKENYSTYYSGYARVMMKNNYYDDAIECYKKALEYQFEAVDHDTIQLAVLYDNMGIAYGSRGDYETALKCQLSAAKTMKNLEGDYTENLRIAYYHIAATYYKLGNDELGHKYYGLYISLG